MNHKKELLWSLWVNLQNCVCCDEPYEAILLRAYEALNAV